MIQTSIFDRLESSAWLDAVLNDLRSETVEQIKAREESAFDALASPFSESLVLFGTGHLGRSTLRGLRSRGLEPLAFADNNSALWGTQVEGLQVLSPNEAVSRFASNACFVVTVYHGKAVMDQLKALGCPRVSYIAPLFWKYADVFIPSMCMALPHWIMQQDEAEIRAGYNCLSDDISRREFCEQLIWRVRLDPSVLSPHLAEKETYFPDDIVRPLPGEVFVDCGAFNGDSARSFLSHRQNQFGRIYALEPDPGNRAALGKWIDSLPPDMADRIEPVPYGVSDQNATLYFNVTNTAGSSLLTGETDFSIECRTLDTLFAEKPAPPTYIKMDIEGAEPQALSGGAQLLGSAKPVMAVCTYHRCEHMWQIPALLKSICPDYHLFLKRYAEDCWEMVCYAVPPARLQSGK